MKNRQDIISKALDRLNCFLAENGLPKAKCVHLSKKTLPAIEFNSGKRLSILDATAIPATKIEEECTLRGKESMLAIAPFFPPAAAELLGAAHVNYIDTAGNLLLRVNGNVLCVRNCPRPPELIRRITPGRCWNPQGLKVLFLLLTEKDALNWTYREIAAGCGVSLGTINNVVREAQERGHLLKWGKGFRWGDRNRMIDLWAANYALQLLPRLEVTKYQGEPIPTDGKCPLIAGGETAAAEAGLAGTTYGEYWRQGNVAPVIAKARWRIADDGNITVKKAFWPETRSFTGHVHWLLVYADLLSKDDSRCQEIAAEVRAKYLEVEP